MRRDAFKKIPEILAGYRRHHAWRKVVRAMACVVVFCTTYALILPAITLEKKPACGMEEHTHTEECYAQITSVEKTVPICTLESLNLHRHTEDCQDGSCGYADFVAHTHDDRCLDENGQLWCPIQEREAHTHTESCYALPEGHVHGEDCYRKEKGELTCTVPEGEIPHTHSKEAGCYEEVRKLTCGLEERASPLPTGTEESEGHTHGDACKDENGELTCALEEAEGHKHGDGCYTTVEKLTCALSDQPHRHTDECYAWEDVLNCAASTEQPVLTCEKEEIRLHEHTEECFETDEEGNTYLICGKVQILEHVHTDTCFETEGEKVDTKSRTCGMKEGEGAHAHMESCYDEEKNLICGEGHHHTSLCYGEWMLTCGKEEHTHTPECMVDVETEEEWEKTLPETLSDNWREDLLAVAESQLNYAEARPDFQLGEDPRRWSRYGEWYGQPDGEWNTLFVMFCLRYAGIPEEAVPRDSDVSAWVEKLAGRADGFEKYRLYYCDEDYTPRPGDLVFLGEEGDEAADRVGIVTKVGSGLARSSENDMSLRTSPQTGVVTEGNASGAIPSMDGTTVDPSVGSGLARSSSAGQAAVLLETIEGDVSGVVAERTYPMDGLRILGYAALPEKPVEKPVEPVLICGREEHTHTELCGSPDPEGTGLTVTCGKEEHTHTDECYALPIREYRYEDETVSVTVVLPKNSQVPGDASLRVTPIQQGEERYAQLERQAHAAAAAEVGQLVLYDVSFYTPAGEYLPVEESADVTITFKQTVLSGGQVEVLHYGEDSAPVALEGVEIQRDENEALSGLRFQTNGFSVFGVMTTREAGDNARAANDITLYPGQVYTVDEVYTKTVTQSPEGIVDIGRETYPDILKTGSDLNLSGNRVNARNAEYEITPVGEKYTAVHNGASGEPTVYFNMSSGLDGRPSSSEEAEEFSILDQYSALPEGSNTENGKVIHEGMFAFSTTGPNHCLFFHAGTGNPGYELGFEIKPDPYNSWGSELLLYKYAGDGNPGSEEIPGYVQVTQKSDIIVGEKYLIVGKVQDEHQSNYGIYRVLYPNSSATNRYEHAAKVSPYKLTLTGKNYGDAATADPAATTTVTVGTQQWTLTVNEQVSVSEGGTVSIPLPEGAEVASTDTNIVSAAMKDGAATVTGVTRGSTTVTVTEGAQTYTWYVTVSEPNSFQLNCDFRSKPNMIFHLKDANTGEDLAVDAVTNYAGTTATKYILVEEGSIPAETLPNQQYIEVPKIDGYRFAGAEYYRSWQEDWIPISGFVTAGYSDSEFTVQDDGWTNFVFYQNGKPAPDYNLADDVSAIKVNVNYRRLPITTTISPSGTTINLFDYWVTGEDEGQVGGNRPNEGINKGHALHFTTEGDALELNQWTHSEAARSGIVADRLGSDGYPKLSGSHQNQEDPAQQNKESLAYLFDPSYTGPSAEFRKAYHNVNGLLQLDDQGYYYYDSTENYAEYDGADNSFNLYPDWSVTHRTVNGQFFPFDPYSTVDQRTGVPEPGDPGTLNHFFGMTMSTRFVQQNGGYTGAGKNIPMTFEFSGDDDVWIFIDGVLAADLGGIHNKASVEINFAAGNVTINNDPPQSFQDIFEGTNVELTTGGIFPDNSYHTLKFYYMERGGVASNLHLKFNLVSFPASGITKVDQVGNSIQGAEFELYRTGSDYDTNAAEVELICSGATDTEGEFVFIDKEGQPLVLEELFNGKDRGNTDGAVTFPYYVLRETKVPEGYRGTGTDIHLEIKRNSGSGANASSYVMTCTNTRDSGAFASPSLQVTASNKLHLAATGEEITPGETPGTLFGMVLKYIGTGSKDLANTNNWAPIYGSAAEGYTIVDRGQYPNIVDAVKVAREQIGQQNDFHLSPNGSFQALIKDLPGDIATYNFMAGNTNQDNVQYIVAYYWMDESGKISQVRDYTHAESQDTYSFTRVFGTDIQVPNMVNRIAVQKLDEDNETPVNGAVFGMYKVQETGDKQYYIATDGTELFLEPDTDRDYQGAAWVKGTEDTKGTYTVDHEGEGMGTISVTVGESTYTIQPFQTKTTVDGNSNNYKEDGIAEFDKIVSGQYIIRELTAPAGYSVNYHPAMVLVTPNAIYANAGDKTDGIAVSRGPGYLAGNLHYYATIGQIENTLCWIYTQMKVSDESGSFADINANSYNAWKWVQTKRADAYGPSAVQPGDRSTALTAYLKYKTEGTPGSGGESTAQFSYAVDEDMDLANPTAGKRKPTASQNVGPFRRLYTTTGWSYLEVLQDYAYGKNSPPKAVNANYENWQYLPGTETPDDLSNLFSRSIYIHVTDQRACNLEISKTVEPEDGEPVDESDSFEFTVSLKDSRGAPMRNVAYQVYNSTDRTKALQTGTISDGGTLTLKHNQVAVVKDIPFGTYSVTETEDTDYTTTYIRDAGLPPITREEKDESGTAPLVQIAGESAGEGQTVSGALYWKLEEDGTVKNTSTVAFRNKPLPDLVIVKFETGSPQVLLPGADFTLCRVDAAGNPIAYYVNQDGAVSWTAEPNQATVLTTGEQETEKGKVTLHRIPDGRYKLTETNAPEGYLRPDGPVMLTVQNGKFVSAALGTVPLTANGAAAITDQAPSNTVYVPNSEGFELPHTGGVGREPIQITGFILCLAAGGLLLQFLASKKQTHPKRKGTQN